MKRAEKEIMDAFFIEWEIYNRASNEAFKMLQDESREKTGTAFCSAYWNYKELLEHGHDRIGIYERYIESEAKKELIMEIGQKFANLGCDVYVGM